MSRKEDLEKARDGLQQELMQVNDQIDRQETWLAQLKDVQKTLKRRYDTIERELAREGGGP